MPIAAQRVMTVGPMIVRTRDASTGSPTTGLDHPATIDSTPRGRDAKAPRSGGGDRGHGVADRLEKGSGRARGSILARRASR